MPETPTPYLTGNDPGDETDSPLLRLLGGIHYATLHPEPMDFADTHDVTPPGRTPDAADFLHFGSSLQVKGECASSCDTNMADL